MDLVVFTVHPKGEGISVCLEDWNYAYPVTLGENALCGKADRVGLHQLLGGIVDSVIRKASHWVHLRRLKQWSSTWPISSQAFSCGSTTITTPSGPNAPLAEYPGRPVFPVPRGSGDLEGPYAPRCCQPCGSSKSQSAWCRTWGVFWPCIQDSWYAHFHCMSDTCSKKKGRMFNMAHWWVSVEVNAYFLLPVPLQFVHGTLSFSPFSRWRSWRFVPLHTPHML